MAEDNYEDLRNKVLQISSAKYYIKYLDGIFTYNEPSLELETEAIVNIRRSINVLLERGS